MKFSGKSCENFKKLGIKKKKEKFGKTSQNS